MTKDSIKRSLIKNRAAVKALYYFYRYRSLRTFNKAIKERESIDLFDVEALSKELPYCPKEWVIDNNLYGYISELKHFANINHPLDAYCEHGLFLGRVIHEDQRHWYTSKFITMSEWRKEAISSQLPNKKTLPIGPYLHYARPFLDETQFKELKRKLGKVLLVFPGHSVKNLKVEFNLDNFIDQIKKLAEGYDTILMSVYFLDAQLSEALKPYRDAGFKIVCSGHKFDPNFVRRQKTIIQLADYTVSNEVGTHLGYCLFMNKPHFIFQQELKRKGSQTEQQRHASMLTDSDRVSIENQKRELIGLFNKSFESGISQDQLLAIKKYWGFDSLKTKEELRQFLLD